MWRRPVFFMAWQLHAHRIKGSAQRVHDGMVLEHQHGNERQFELSGQGEGLKGLHVWLVHNSENTVFSQETEHDQTGWLENLYSWPDFHWRVDALAARNNQERNSSDIAPKPWYLQHLSEKLPKPWVLPMQLHSSLLRPTREDKTL